MSAQLGAIGAQLGLTRPGSPGGPEESGTDSVTLPGAVDEGQGVFALEMGKVGFWICWQFQVELVSRF